jgi:hypothetical protein
MLIREALDVLLSPRGTLAKLHDVSNFLGGYPDNQKSAIFEYIISKSFADALSLPFFTSTDNDPAKKRKVLWNGSLSPISKAPPGPDCLIHAYSYNCVVEPTRREGADQWTLEGAPLLRHTTNAIAQFHWNQLSTYSILVATKIAHDTYYNFHTNTGDAKIVLFEVEHVIGMLETSILAISMRPMELSSLMEEALNHLRLCPNLRSYRTCIANSVSTWRQRILESEKHVFVGLKALKTMKSMKRAPPIGLGELFGKMSQNNWVKHYLGLLEQPLEMRLIFESLSRLGFAYFQPGMHDTLIYPVMLEELINRASRIHEQIRMVEF